MFAYDRPYDAYLILGDPANTPAWSKPMWTMIINALNPVVAMSSARAAVRTFRRSIAPVTE